MQNYEISKKYIKLQKQLITLANYYKIQDIETLVKNWRHKFKLDVRDSKKVLDNIKNLTQDEIDLAFRLIKEELDETYKALSEKNVTETFDGIGDTIVTLWQLFSIIGLNTKQLTEIVRIVTESNMSKACETQSEVEDTIASYNASFDDVVIDAEDETFMLIFRKDGKLLKNYYYKTPNFKPFIESLWK
jgi:F0F1-type ATP synthase gamma subunit